MTEREGAALPRVVGLGGAVWLGLGSILGTGVFVSLGVAAGVAGPGLLWAVVLAALLALANGLSSAQLAAAHPVSGGTYEYGHRLLNPSVGFAAGWMFLAAKSASAATAALGCAGYLLHTLGLTDDVRVRVPVALGFVALLAVLVAGGLRRSNVVNGVVVTATVTALVAFVAFGMAAAGPGAFDPGLVVPGLRAALAKPASLFHATALMFVAYTGYGRIATLGEEVHEPSRTIPLAVVVTLGLSLLLYASVAATALATVGAGAFASATSEAAAPLEVVARSLGRRWLPGLVGVSAIGAMAGVLLNLLLGLSRVVLAMARRGELPAPLSRLDSEGRGPTRAVWAVALVIAGLTLLGDVRVTWSFSAFTVLVYYGVTNLAALRLPPADRRFPRWIAVAGLLSCFALAFFVPRPIWVAGLALLLVGFGVRAVLRARGSAPPAPDAG